MLNSTTENRNESFSIISISFYTYDNIPQRSQKKDQIKTFVFVSILVFKIMKLLATCYIIELCSFLIEDTCFLTIKSLGFLSA